MDKYTAFNLYRSGWTTQGAAVAVPLEPDGERHDVYLASDVEALKQALQRCIDAIDYTYGHCYGLPSQLIEANDAAKSLMVRES
jgi:hypothetical protein